jgi:probable dihydroxyacetone kinase regulator
LAQFTKKAIRESFSRLLEEKPLDKITVKDIVEDCEINRGTFYYYYPDIYALVEDIFEDEVRRIASEHVRYDSWQEAFLAATQLAKKEKRQLYHAFNAISRDKLEAYLYRVSEQLMRDFVSQQAEGLDVAQEDKDFIAKFYVCALVGLTGQWIDSGMKEDPEYYIGKMGALFDGNIRLALEKAAKKQPGPNK